MEEVTIIGVDLAKNVFQPHGAAVNGAGRGEILKMTGSRPSRWR